MIVHGHEVEWTPENSDFLTHVDSCDIIQDFKERRWLELNRALYGELARLSCQSLSQKKEISELKSKIFELEKKLENRG